MKVLNVFLVVSILGFGTAGWWYAGSHMSELTDLGLSGLGQMIGEAFQGMLNAAGDAVALPLEIG